MPAPSGKRRLCEETNAGRYGTHSIEYRERSEGRYSGALRHHPIAPRSLLRSVAVAWWRSSDESPSSTDGDEIERESSEDNAAAGRRTAWSEIDEEIDRNRFAVTRSDDQFDARAWSDTPGAVDDPFPVGFPTAEDVAHFRNRPPIPARPDGPTGDGSPGRHSPPESEKRMAATITHTDALKTAMEIEGALGVALVDSTSGMALATAGSPMDLDLEVAAAGNSSVVQAKLRTMADLGLQQSIEDILITLDKQYHIIRLLHRQPTVFLYLVLDRARANLAMARFRLTSIEKDLVV
jgi:hypothetical protein